MTRVSEHFGLGKNQPSLDFVDVPIDGDVQLFIDPTSLSLLDTEWGARCRALIQNYFSEVINSIKDGEDDKAKKLLSVLGEPNETRLGYSSEKPKGHGMGNGLAVHMWHALKDSMAVRTGVIHDLEDTALLIDGVSSDIISDITTNIIRQPLLEYTAAMCKEYGIPTEEVGSGRVWNMDTKAWTNGYVQQPVAGGKLLLIPKGIVRTMITFDADNYYNVYLLTQLQQEEAAKGFVRLLKNGEARPPTKKSLKARQPPTKEANRRLTPERTQVLQKYREDKRNKPREALSHERMAEQTHTQPPDWANLLSKVTEITPGTEQANDYEKSIKELFDALFYPWLMYPETQEKIHEGRKRIDITYTNMAADDFFYWLRENYTAPYVVVECKNYTSDPENPELDQLSGRFSTRRGQFGLLVCRKIDNKSLFLQRCKDTVKDGRGYIIALDDDDIALLVNAVEHASDDEKLKILRDKFKELVS